MNQKSSLDEIRERFDHDVERFSNLETGQTATIDSPLMLDLIASAAAATSPHARSLLDVGCGAGNYSLKLLERLPGLDCTLIDLSLPMLDRAHGRVSSTTQGRVETIQGDVRSIDLGEGRFDVILAAMVLHHLRTDDEWRAVFAAFFRSLRPGGSVWIADMVKHEIEAVEKLQRERYGDYLTGFRDASYRDSVFAYIEKEDTPQSLRFQLDRLREAGFAEVDVLHMNTTFAAFGARKP